MHIQGKSVNYMQPINIVDFYITWSKKALDSTTKSSCKTGQLNWRKTELCDPEALTLSLFVNIRLQGHKSETVSLFISISLFVKEYIKEK